MKQLHIVTVGISLLNNYCRETNTPIGKAVKQSAQVRAFVEKNPRKASAELNAFLGRAEIRKLSLTDISVALVYTQTQEGALAAGVLKHWLNRQGVQTTEIKLKDIQLPAHSTPDSALPGKLAQKGLEALRSKVEAHVLRRRSAKDKLPVEFNVTGGYKAEVAVLYALGKKLGCPVYYLHESYKAVIELP